MNVARARPNVRARQPENPRAGVPYLVPFLFGSTTLALFQDTIREFFGQDGDGGLNLTAVATIVGGLVLLVLLLVVATN